ncbi:putative nickel-responsive regulator, partial [Dissostichus eleginoides]
MASLSLLLLCTALIHAAQVRHTHKHTQTHTHTHTHTGGYLSSALPIGRGGGRGLDTSVGGVRRQRRDLVLPYEDRMMSYPATQGGGRASSLYYQSDDLRGRGLDEALQRLVERDQRREQEEEQRAAYLSALLRLLSEAESAGLGDFLSDYDESGLRMRRPAWWGVLEPQLAQALMDRMDPQLAQALLQGNRSERPLQAGRGTAGDQDTLRLMESPPFPDDMAPPSPSKRPPPAQSEAIGRGRAPPPAGLQRMKRIDAMATEELHHGSRSRRRRRAAQDYDPQILMDQIL